MPFDDAPYGVFEFLHRWGLRGASLETAPVWGWIELMVLPLIPLYIQAYLLVGTGQSSTRVLRAALALITVALMARGWTSWRFTMPEYNVFNNTAAVTFFHLCYKSIEFGLLPDPINDPYIRRGRSRAVAAFDLCLNSRMMSLGSVGLDTAAGAPNATITDIKVERHLRHAHKHHHKHTVPKARNCKVANGFTNGNSNGHLNSSGHLNSNGIGNGAVNGTGVKHKHDYYVSEDLHRPKTRAGSIARHIRQALSYYLVLDAVLALGRRMGPGTISDTYASTQSDLIGAFLRKTGFTLLPGILGWDVPRFVIQFIVICCVPLVIWQGLSLGYHIIAIFTLATGLWEVRAWDVDLFNAPWKADSLLDLWGKRWHQIFRHQFIVMSAATLKFLRLPSTPFTLFPLTFLFSGLLHSIGGMSTHPSPAPIPVTGFFLLTGLGCTLEVLFKRVTGRRVHGHLGRLWVWATMLSAGFAISGAWFDAGVNGNHIFPIEGPGRFIAEWLMRHAWVPYERV